MVYAGDAATIRIAPPARWACLVDEDHHQGDNDGELRAIVPDLLTYKGVDQPHAEDSGADAIPRVCR